MYKTRILTLMAVLVSLCLSPAAGQQQPDGAAEMEKLKLLVGTWSYTETYAKGASGTGTYSAQLGPGGYSLIIDFTTHMATGDEIGHAILTWDPKERVYKQYAVGNDFPGCAIFTGKREGEVLNFYGEFETPRGKMTLKNTYTEWTPKSITIEGFVRVGDGPFRLLHTTKAVKP